MIENSQAWLGASTSAAIADYHGQSFRKVKSQTWTQSQMQDAMEAVITQRMMFTESATHHGIPKGTLYDKMLGKSNRMAILDKIGLSANEEKSVLEFCCETNVTAVNKRTPKSLKEVMNFVEKLKRDRDPNFEFEDLTAFRWWWAFRKKHSIYSTYCDKSPKSKKLKTQMDREEAS